MSTSASVSSSTTQASSASSSSSSAAAPTIAPTVEEDLAAQREEIFQGLRSKMNGAASADSRKFLANVKALVAACAKKAAWGTASATSSSFTSGLSDTTVFQHTVTGRGDYQHTCAGREGIEIIPNGISTQRFLEYRALGAARALAETTGAPAPVLSDYPALYVDAQYFQRQARAVAARRPNEQRHDENATGESASGDMNSDASQDSNEGGFTQTASSSSSSASSSSSSASENSMVASSTTKSASGTFVGLHLTAGSLKQLADWMSTVEPEIANQIAGRDMHVTLVNSDAHFDVLARVDASSASSSTSSATAVETLRFAANSSALGQSNADADLVGTTPFQLLSYGLDEAGGALAISRNTFALSVWKTKQGKNCLVLRMESSALTKRHMLAR